MKIIKIKNVFKKNNFTFWILEITWQATKSKTWYNDTYIFKYHDHEMSIENTSDDIYPILFNKQRKMNIYLILAMFHILISDITLDIVTRTLSLSLWHIYTVVTHLVKAKTKNDNSNKFYQIKSNPSKK